MSNERLGVVEEMQAQRARFARYAYVAPQDRLARMEPPKPAPVEPPAPAVRVPPALRLNYKAVGSQGGSHGGGHPVEDMEGMTAKVRDVLTVFAEAFGVDVSNILSASRKKKHVRPRQAVMHYLSCSLKLSFHSVGKVMKRDHSSAFSGTSKAVFLFANDVDFICAYGQSANILREMWTARYHASVPK